jgi:hypothetical protein
MVSEVGAFGRCRSTGEVGRIANPGPGTQTGVRDSPYSLRGQRIFRQAQGQQPDALNNTVATEPGVVVSCVRNSRATGKDRP